ncbi:MAG: PaaI family thioesterase, partial [Oscillospiraceae bacterium]|nr:PaaI family thioesterase [Oscillospiraceae bacterium]
MTYNLDDFRRFFSADAFAALAGVQIDSVSDERVVCSMEIAPKHRNALGGVQGGAVFTLADSAFAVHSNLSLIEDGGAPPTVGQSCAVSYLRPSRGTVLYAES